VSDPLRGDGGRTERPSLTSISGLRVGHASDLPARTGCTVVLGPFRAAVDVRGSATGTRELGTLAPDHLAASIDAILLTGGSAFGLAAADGVTGWLEARGAGFDVGVARVPIVVAAVVFDLHVGDPGRRPDAAMGAAACEDARADPVEEGRIGAGTGATVGKGAPGAVPDDGGVGSWAVSVGPHTIGALVVANAGGEIRDAAGEVVAGARSADGARLDTPRAIVDAFGSAPGSGPGRNTTLAVVATDAPLDRVALGTLARAGSSGLARRVHPYGTPFDGDLVFALSTSGAARAVPPGELLALCTAAADVCAEAVVRAVRG
jgi:L-aminopeptidase/D-esterase-like protein